MPITDLVAVKDLELDLNNFRTIPQKNELGAVHALVSIDPEWFWALTESLIEDGYLPTENIIVLKKQGSLIVKEGNRRVGAMKLILGYITSNELHVPSRIKKLIADIDPKWSTKNRKIPCAIYDSSEEAVVNNIVRLIHGKGEQAGRLSWTPVAKARENRENGAKEIGLDLLEKYLKHGKNLTAVEREEWSGIYPLTVLEEAIKKIAKRMGAASTSDLVNSYPNITDKMILDAMLKDIGQRSLTFPVIRDATDFGVSYGLAPLPSSSAGTKGGGTATKPKTKQKPKKIPAVSAKDPKSVTLKLKAFTPTGNNRDKVVTLLHEARTLKLTKHPLAFCFLLRSMFEISAKAYCQDHAKSGGPSAVKNGIDRKLVEVLRDITKHLTNNNQDKEMVKRLHGAMTELARADGILSVTSMNQLVHNPTFQVDDSHISVLFGNIFPLLEALNS